MKSPEHYLNCGYEDVGYKSPELSSSDIYPSYIEEEVRESVNEIQSHQNEKTITFGFMTDIHYSLSYNHDIRMKRTVNAYREISKRAFIDKLILGGDYTNEGCKEYKTRCYQELRARFDGVTYYPIHGNHDDGTIWDISYIKADKSTNHLTHTDLYNVFYNHLPSLGAEFDENNHSLYYVINDNSKKMRYICLDTCDIPYVYDENGKLKYSGQWTFAMSQKQIDWLVNKALNFSEEGWTTALYVHSTPLHDSDFDTDLLKNMKVFTEIMEAYKKGEKLQGIFGEGDFEVKVNVDFSNYIRGDVCGVIVGDHHTDAIKTTDSGVNYIFTANSVTYYVGGITQIPRQDGDKSEMLFDIMTVDKEKRMIYITRVGAGNNRTVKY